MFSGKAKDWRMWSVKFLALTHSKKCKNILLGKVKVPRADDDIAPGDKKGTKRNSNGVLEDYFYTEEEYRELKFAREANYWLFQALVSCSMVVTYFSAVDKPRTHSS